VYNAQGDIEKTLGGLLFLPGGFLGDRVTAVYRDLDGDGKPEKLLSLASYSGTLMKVDESNGRIVPIAASGFIQDIEIQMLLKPKPSESELKRYAPLFKAYAVYPKNVPAPRYWTWADLSGDAVVQPEEIKLFTGDWGGGTY